MTISEQVSSIEASFAMEDMEFDEACRNRVRNILEEKISVADAIDELNKKYGVKENGKPRV